MIQATAANIGRLRDALREAYRGDPNIDDITDEDLLGEYPAVRYYPEGGGDLYFDVLTRLGEAVNFATIECERREIQGISVSLTTPRALFLLKRDGARDRPAGRRRITAQRFSLDEES